jgi:hypothetical protein
VRQASPNVENPKLTNSKIHDTVIKTRVQKDSVELCIRVCFLLRFCTRGIIDSKGKSTLQSRHQVYLSDSV